MRTKAKKLMDWSLFFKVISYIAAVSTTISFLPQAIKCIVTKDTKNISLWMYVIFVFGTACWAAYGLYFKDWAISAANIVTFVLASIILTMKIINLKKDKSEKA